mmetsp:Transcript_15981/g.47422  ORF Transcript_15981/g.47422 Transcript_15981/m.47422 type:complete len:250 (+) Transcript_15981:3918-4667(+)
MLACELGSCPRLPDCAACSSWVIMFACTLATELPLPGPTVCCQLLMALDCRLPPGRSCVSYALAERSAASASIMLLVSDGPACKGEVPARSVPCFWAAVPDPCVIRPPDDGPWLAVDMSCLRCKFDCPWTAACSNPCIVFQAEPPPHMSVLLADCGRSPLLSPCFQIAAVSLCVIGASGRSLCTSVNTMPLPPCCLAQVASVSVQPRGRAPSSSSSLSSPSPSTPTSIRFGLGAFACSWTGGDVECIGG